MKVKIDSLSKYRLPLYLVALAFFVTTSMLTRTFYAPYVVTYVGKIILLSWGILAIIEIHLFITEGYSFREIIGALFIGTMFLIVMRWGGSAAEFASFLPFAFVARNLEFKKIANFLVYWQGIILIGVVVSACLGIIENFQELNYTEAGLVNEGIRMCYCVGFLDHLFPGYYMLNLTMLFLYIVQKKIKNWHAIVLLMANSLVFLIAHGRYSFIFSVIGIIAIWMLRDLRDSRIKDYMKKISCGVAFMVPIFALMSYVISVQYDDSNPWWHKLNIITGDRIVHASIGLKEWGIKILGQSINMVGGGLTIEGAEATGTYNWIDNAWMNMLFRFGILFTVGFVGLFTIAMCVVWKKKQYSVLLLLFVMLCWMMLDDNSILLASNGLLLLFAIAFEKSIVEHQKNTELA